ncbi:PQQ-binding-like beta-propeller repeat protein [Vulgatibacter sp.]|uniref:outer membrane protein assembly factor BamB family protein n=1 Tax=Vulgatibacter sp. TaxID=1971226 RepID=UPI003568BDE3
MHIRATLPLLALLVLACSEERLSHVHAGLDLPDAIHFDRAFVGHEATAPIAIANRGLAREFLGLAVDPPFALSTSAVEVAAGAEASPLVRLLPERVGRHEATLTLSVRGDEVHIPVTAEVAEAPACPAATDCSSWRFDPAVGACVEEAVPDDTPCDGGACLEAARCRAGSCVGLPACDDGDPCTADLCSAEAGCSHVPDASCCEQPDHPCLEAFLEEGVCGVRARPEGAPCDGACGTGTCDGGVCNGGGDGVLTAAWSYEPAGHMSFFGHADEAGHLYLLEGEDDRAWYTARTLVSLDREGRERFRLAAGASREIALLGARLFTVIDGELVARSTATAARLWSVSLPAVLPGAHVEDGATVRLLAADGRLRVVTWWSGSSCAGPGHVAAFDPATGARSWSHREEAILAASLLGSAGEVHFQRDHSEDDGCTVDFRFHRIDASGRAEGPSGGAGNFYPEAVAGDHLFAATHGESRWMGIAGDGPALPIAGRHPFCDAEVRLPPLVRGPLAFGFGVEEPVVVGHWQAPFLYSFDPATGIERWRLQPPMSVRTTPLLTDRGTALLVGHDQQADGHLVEYDGTGASVARCAITAPPRGGAAVLLDGLLVVGDCGGGLQAWSLPGRRIAPDGWVTTWGDQQRSRLQYAPVRER